MTTPTAPPTELTDSAIIQLMPDYDRSVTLGQLMDFARRIILAAEPYVIAAFLERTGQYVTNDASREAAISAAILADRERQKPDVDSSRSAGAPPLSLTPGTVYQTRNYGPGTYVGVDMFHGLVTHEFRTKDGTRYARPEDLGWFLGLDKPANVGGTVSGYTREQELAMVDQPAEARPTDKPAVGIGSGEPVAWRVNVREGLDLPPSWMYAETEDSLLIPSFKRQALYTQTPVERQAVAADWKLALLSAAARSGDPGAIKLAAQLADAQCCESCGYVKQHCRCAAPAVEEPTA